MGPQPRFGANDQWGTRAGERSESNVILLVGDWDLEDRRGALQRVCAHLEEAARSAGCASESVGRRRQGGQLADQPHALERRDLSHHGRAIPSSTGRPRWLQGAAGSSGNTGYASPSRVLALP